MSVIYHVFDFVTWTAVSVSKIYITCLKLSVLPPVPPSLFHYMGFFLAPCLGRSGHACVYSYLSAVNVSEKA